MTFEWREVWVPKDADDAMKLRREWEKTLADIDYWADTHGPEATGYDGKMHMGTGMSRLSAMATLLARSGLAGKEFQPTFVRDLSGTKAVALHLASDAHEALASAAAHTDQLAAAVAKVVADIQGAMDELLDYTTSSGFRGITASVINSQGSQFVERVKAEMKSAATPAQIPDFPTLKGVLIERLEAVATGKQKHMKGALTQQAIDNWAACVEVDQALQKVALECAVGALRIRNAADAKKAQAAFSAAVTAVEAVSPVNIPEVTHAIAGRRVTIRAVNPTVDPAVRGPVSVVSTGVASTDGSTITGKITASDGLPVKDSDPMLLRWDFADDYGGKVRIAVEVRNVCGPATYSVDLEVTGNGGIRAV